MKRFSLLVAMLLVSTLLAPAFAASSKASSTPDHVTLTWTGDPATTMTITWRTDTTIAKGIVQFGQGSTLPEEFSTAPATADDFTTDLGKMKIFSTTLTALSPDTKYSYRVGDGTHWSKTHTFSTADPNTLNVKFLVFGDSQSVAAGNAPYSLWRATVHNAFAANPDARFIVNVGDLVDTGQSNAHWEAWFAAAAGVIDTIPMVPVLGNHETYGQPGKTKPAYWLRHFTLPRNGPPGLQEQAYSFRYGPLHCAVLDSQQTEEKSNIFAPQKKWLDDDLAAAKTTWKMAFFHKSPYSIFALRPNRDVKAAFCPILEKHHVDLVFNGHDHGVARTFPIKNGARMQRPSQGTIYYTAGRSGQKSYKVISKISQDAFFVNPLDQPNYLVVEVNDQTVTVKTVKMDGKLIDTFFIDKTKDTSSDSPQQGD